MAQKKTTIPWGQIAWMIAGVTLMLFPFISYYYNFRRFPISDNPEKWAQFGDYLNGTFMPLIALMGIIITFMLGLISDKRNKINVQIEQEKHKPMLNIDYWDGEHMIYLKMTNKGSGPLIITNYQVNSNKKDAKGLYWVIPPIFGSYRNFTGNQKDKVLGPGEEAELLLMEYDKGSVTSNQWASNLKDLRSVLKNVEIIVDYDDVYGKRMLTYKRTLEWFGREKRELQKDTKKH